MATFLVNATSSLAAAADLSGAGGATSFTDVADNTHETNIRILVGLGITSGKGAGRYDPSGRVTRGQLATFVVKAYDAAHRTVLGRGASWGASAADYFADDNGTTHEANINILASLGVASGGTRFESGRLATRREMASFLAGRLNWAPSDGLTPAPVKSGAAANRPPVAKFSYLPSNPQAGVTVNFDGSMSADPDGSISSYQWQFGDGGTARGRKTANAFQSAGTYRVSLTVVDDHGSSHSTSQLLAVAAPTQGSREQRIARVLDDAGHLGWLLDAFWTKELQALYGVAFDAPDRLEYYLDDHPLSCGGVAYVAPRNAHYCTANWDEHVAFDMEWFQSMLIDHPGGATTYLILAHGWGHAVDDTFQDRGAGWTWSPSYREELGADCLAGSFLYSATVTGDIIWEAGDDEAIFSLLSSLGSPWMDPGGHGSWTQRLAAFQDGWDAGTHDCLTRY